MSSLYQNSKTREQSAPLLFGQPRNKNGQEFARLLYHVPQQAPAASCA